MIELVPGQWQRWRMLYSGVKAFFVANVNDPKTGAPTSNCQIAMYAKDGVYMQQVPRTIQAPLLVAGGRVEVLVRCTGAVGARVEAVCRSVVDHLFVVARKVRAMGVAARGGTQWLGRVCVCSGCAVWC